MNATISGIAFIMLVTVAFHYLCYVLGSYRKELFEVKRYKIFSLRDKIVRFAIQGKIKEDDDIFQFLYKSANALASIEKPLGLKKIIYIVNDTPAVKFEKNEIIDALQHRDPDVRIISLELLSCFVEIILSSSTIVRILANTGRFISIIAKSIRFFLPFIFKTEETAYGIYKKLELKKNSI